MHELEINSHNRGLSTWLPHKVVAAAVLLEVEWQQALGAAVGAGITSAEGGAVVVPHVGGGVLPSVGGGVLPLAGGKHGRLKTAKQG